MNQHQASLIQKAQRHALLLRQGAIATWHNDSRTKEKTYPRMIQIPLPTPADISAPLTYAFEKRISVDTCAFSDTPVTVQELSDLLASLRTKINGKRPYPSGGALYPAEVYVVGPLDGEPACAFHYRPEEHTIEKLWALPDEVQEPNLYNEEEGRNTRALSILFSAVWNRSAIKYGDFAFSLTLIEMGHMAQNITLSAAARNIGARTFAGFNSTLIHRVLNLQNAEEQIVYALRLGHTIQRV